MVADFSELNGSSVLDIIDVSIDRFALKVVFVHFELKIAQRNK